MNKEPKLKILIKLCLTLSASIVLFGRRKDYVTSRAGQIPSVKGAAEQLMKKLDEKELKTLFVATDAPPAEFDELK